jgi:hypothetical protein
MISKISSSGGQEWADVAAVEISPAFARVSDYLRLDVRRWQRDGLAFSALVKTSAVNEMKTGKYTLAGIFVEELSG